MKRKKRKGEVVCRCGAYRFPHREFGGECDGSHIVHATFEQQMWGECRGCHYREADDEGNVLCQVVEGRDKVTGCPEVEDHIRYNGIRLYGVNADPRIENPKRRR